MCVSSLLQAHTKQRKITMISKGVCAGGCVASYRSLPSLYINARGVQEAGRCEVVNLKTSHSVSVGDVGWKEGRSVIAG